MKIILKRAVPIVAFKAVMEIGEIKKDYDFYLSVLELEEEFNEITPALVNEHLLQRNPNDVIGNRIVKMMVLFRLLTALSSDDNLQITPKGEEFIQNLRKGHYNLIENDLKNTLVNNGVLLNINGNYSPNGNNPFSLIHDIEFNKVIRLEFKEVYDFLESQKYIIPQTFRFKMTDIGRVALESEKVPIAQSSSYTIYTTEDPVFDDNHIIAYEPIHLNERDWNNKESNVIKKPDWLDDLIGVLRGSPKIFQLAAQNLDEIYLYGIFGEIFPSSKKINVNISITLSNENKPELKIIREKFKPNPFEHKINLTISEAIKIIQKIIPFEITQVDDKYALLVSYKAIKSNKWKNNRTIDYPLKNIEFPSLGQFDEVIIENIGLLPKTEDDAVDWAKDLVSDKLTYYFSEDTYDNVTKEVSEKFSHRFPVQSRLPSFTDFVSEIASRKNTDPKIFWFANAPKCLTIRGDNP